MSRSVHNEILDHRFDLPDRPRRIVSLVSSATEALENMGMLDRVIGVSEYCDRYIPGPVPPVVGQYLNCDISGIVGMNPDLVLTTGGVQRKLALKLAKAGLPVYVLALPQSFAGMLENNVILGRLVNELGKARRLNVNMEARAHVLREKSPVKRPTVYLELWLGRHMRAVGGASFINDLVELAGGDLIFRDRTEDYFTPDFGEVAALKPDIHLFFHEPEFLVDPEKLVAERSWNADTPIITSTVDCGRNMIQDGPSFLDTAAWLQKEMIAVFPEI